MKSIAVLLIDGFEEVEAVTPIDFLRRAGIEVIVTGVKEKDVVGAHDIRIDCDVTLDELPIELDGVVVPGGPGSRDLAASADTVELIKRLLASGKLVGAICAAPAVVLGAHGLLKGKKFTCYPGTESSAKDGTLLQDRVVRDGNLITSRGPGTAAEFSLALIEALSGAEAAEKIRKGTIQKV